MTDQQRGAVALTSGLRSYASLTGMVDAAVRASPRRPVSAASCTQPTAARRHLVLAQVPAAGHAVQSDQPAALTALIEEFASQR